MCITHDLLSQMRDQLFLNTTSVIQKMLIPDLPFPRIKFRSNWLVDPSTGSYTAALRSPTGIPADPALTAHGVDQAKQLGERLCTAEPPIERVYSSMYYRCLQTIEPFMRKNTHSLKVRGETGLGEWYGSAYFEHPAPANLETLGPMFPEMLDEHYKPFVVPTRMGESVDELHDRVAKTMDALIAECDRDGIKCVLLCSHAAVVIALGRVLTGNMPDNIEVEDFRAFTCGLSVYRRRQLQQQFTGTLPGAGEQIAAHPERKRISDAQNADHASKEGVPDAGWRGGRGVSGGWDCQLNSDCTHLELGEERGW